LLGLLSEIVGTISGFGSSILFVPIASFFFDFKTVLGVTAVFHVFSNLSKIVLFKKGINRRIAFRLGIPAVLCVIIGAWLTTFIPTKPLELLMDIVLIVLAIFLLVNRNKVLNQSDTSLYAGGAVSGMLAGLVGTGGALRGLTLAAFNLPKEIFVATSALIDLGVDVSRSLVYIGNGYFLRQQIALIPFLIGISILGSFIGKQILRHSTEKTFRYLVLGTILLTSFFQIFRDFIH